MPPKKFPNLPPPGLPQPLAPEPTDALSAVSEDFWPGVQGSNRWQDENSIGGIGVSGYSLHGIGVLGTTDDNSAAGVKGEGTIGPGVHGTNKGSTIDEPAIFGENSGKGWGPGVLGKSQKGPGVRGLSAGSDDGIAGVVGENSGGGPGVLGSSDGDGVVGICEGNGDLSGVYGLAEYVPGVVGESSESAGVWGISRDDDGVVGNGVNGVHGRSAWPTGSGVWGENSGGGYGVKASSGGIGLWAEGSPAGHFEGKVEVKGDLEVTDEISGTTHNLLSELKALSDRVTSLETLNLGKVKEWMDLQQPLPVGYGPPAPPYSTYPRIEASFDLDGAIIKGLNIQGWNLIDGKVTVRVATADGHFRQESMVFGVFDPSVGTPNYYLRGGFPRDVYVAVSDGRPNLSDPTRLLWSNTVLVQLEPGD